MNYLTSEKKEEFLLNLKIARDGRAREKHLENSIILLQAQVRGWLTRKHYRQMIL